MKKSNVEKVGNMRFYNDPVLGFRYFSETIKETIKETRREKRKKRNK
jgi:hypothetical protein